MTDAPTGRPRIARIWRGRTTRERPDEYDAYNYEVGAPRQTPTAHDELHFFQAADQLSMIVTGTDRASSVALLLRKR
jgi:hypothetical protein